MPGFSPVVRPRSSWPVGSHMAVAFCVFMCAIRDMVGSPVADFAVIFRSTASDHCNVHVLWLVVMI